MARKYDDTVAKPTNDAYTGMLAISFLALLVGCGLLYLDYSQYPEKPPSAMQREVKDRPSPEKSDKAPPPPAPKKDDDEGGEKKDAEKDKD